MAGWMPIKQIFIFYLKQIGTAQSNSSSVKLTPPSPVSLVTRSVTAFRNVQTAAMSPQTCAVSSCIFVMT